MLIKNLKTYLQQHSNTAIFEGLRGCSASWAVEYAKNYATIDKYFIRKYYNGYVEDMGLMCDNAEDMLDVLNESAINEYIVNGQNWLKLYEATIAEFNPLWNVDGNESVTRTPNLTHTEGARADTTQRANGAKHTSDASKVYPFDDDLAGHNTDAYTHDENAYTDTDSYSKGSQVNTETGSETTLIRRYGNIGVTKSTDLLESAYEWHVNYKFWNTFLEAIFSVCCRYSKVCDVAQTSSSGGGGSVEVTASATASTLEAGSDATASVNCVNNHLAFSFGIPRGADGQDGRDGRDGQDGQDGRDGRDGMAFELVATLTGGTPQTLDFTGKAWVCFATVKNDNWVCSGILPAQLIKNKAFGLDYGAIIGGAGYIGHYAKVLGNANNSYYLQYDFLNSDVSSTSGCTTYVYMC